MSGGLLAADVVVRFGGLVALDGVGVEAPPGRITGLIGPNGAGKTTLFNVCCGFLRPDAGQVTFNGVDVTAMSPAHRARLGLGRTFQRMELFRSLSVRENIEFAAESKYVNADLTPGTYAVFCFISAPDGTPHYKKGMLAKFTVS